MPNHLQDSVSPYLQQHADNPVDWWEWGPDAFAEAARRDVPVFLSVGYSACHWCHVMAHESFEDPATARLLNEHFVSIKVDREERPDVDAVYMRVTTALTGHGGWPMSVWLDHEGRAFHAGTYFPPAPRGGIPSFAEVLTAIWQAWTRRRSDVDASARHVAAALARRDGGLRVVAAADGRDVDARVDAIASLPQRVPTGPAPETAAAVAHLQRDCDPVNGGFGTAPKFPPSMVLKFLLRHFEATSDANALGMVEATCTAMARGGIYDQLAGGFARYSVDAAWEVPHFEKMLYDNALLLDVYSQWWRLTGNTLARRVALETGEFLLRDLRTSSGAFASALDADSIPGSGSALGPGSRPVEGAAYVWTPSEVREVLGDLDGEWAAELLGLTQPPNFEEGTSTLRLIHEPKDADRWQRCRSTLLSARRRRPQPTRDDKVVAEWNGLAIAALTSAGRILSQPEWIAAADSAAAAVLAVHTDRSGRLVRSSRDGALSPAPAVLADYSGMASGLLELAQIHPNGRFLPQARELLDHAIAQCGLEEGNDLILWDAPEDGLLPRNSDPSDNAYPSGGSALCAALLTLEALGDSAADDRGRPVRASALLRQAGSLMADHPRFAGMWLANQVAASTGPVSVVVVGPDSPERAALEAAAVHGTPDGGVCVVAEQGTGGPPLVADKRAVGGAAAAYVCRGRTCLPPVQSAVELAALLGTAGH